MFVFMFLYVGLVWLFIIKMGGVKDFVVVGIFVLFKLFEMVLFISLVLEILKVILFKFFW